MATKPARSAPFSGSFKIGTGKYYRSGQRHYAIDYLCPLGTPLKAVRDGVIIDCNDGESDAPDRNYSGEPSNWIMLGYKNSKGQKRTVYYQHLMKNSIKVHKGQTVKAGELIAKSGNSGNTTGPHLHIAASRGWQNRATRYDYLYAAGVCIWPPSLVWAPDSL